MFESLPQGIKISIARSITTSFEQYMNQIEWDETAYSTSEFIQYWRKYSEEHASWFNKVNEEMRITPSFHKELTDKINELIEKVLSTAPTKEQMDKIDELVKELVIEDVDYCCKAEAKYVINKLTMEIEKKKITNPTATERQMRYASILYYQAFDKELPDDEYSFEKIQEIIDVAQKELQAQKHTLVVEKNMPLQ
ncbi:hypothetical protein [Bacillus solimangrovi]|uniref:Uncharacterized protein n=1 Tax=Bacillus solimangrovi TaxID=1305675 RepID=A0A1E5LFL6_9BACI|nr:hypothetical protein [Bacillus solimangrovi]OEH92846.1 hypothetical protein BFG57_02300 [Bacillus solimangrovi]